MTDVASPGAMPPVSVRPGPPSGSGAVDEAVAIWRALAELGVRDVLVSPGSRSAPAVYALQDPAIADRLRAHVRIDERSAAFTALGISRADPRHPAAVVTTSGTATAHLHAAVLEAHHSRVPLIVLTADRPAELRGTGANQATQQVGLYGEAVRFSFDLPAPQAREALPHELRTAISTMARAFAAATGADPGPVHVNVAFRDPLTPDPDHAPGAAPDDVAGAAGPERPAVGADASSLRSSSAAAPLQLTRRPAPPAPAPVTVPATGRTVIVAGDGAGPEAARLAEAHALPLLSEPSSGARTGPALIGHHVSLLSEVMADPEHSLRPDRAIVMGHPTLSRSVVSRLLGADDVEVIVVDPTDRWADAVRRASLVVPAIDPSAGPGEAEQQRAFLDAWLERARARAAADAHDPALPWQVSAALAVWDANGPNDVLVLGSSSLVRDLEEHAGPAEGAVIANRGLAGIDGIIGTATGVALAKERPADPAPPAGRVRALLGDLTAIHDLTSLVIGPAEVEPALDIVVVDDDGGRIFGGLEHAAAPEQVLRRFFTTPHGVDIAAAAEALGVETIRCSARGLPGVLAQGGGRRLILVQERGPDGSSHVDESGTRAPSMTGEDS